MPPDTSASEVGATGKSPDEDGRDLRSDQNRRRDEQHARGLGLQSQEIDVLVAVRPLKPLNGGRTEEDRVGEDWIRRTETYHCAVLFSGELKEALKNL